MDYIQRTSQSGARRRRLPTLSRVFPQPRHLQGQIYSKLESVYISSCCTSYFPQSLCVSPASKSGEQPPRFRGRASYQITFAHNRTQQQVHAQFASPQPSLNLNSATRSPKVCHSRVATHCCAHYMCTSERGIAYFSSLSSPHFSVRSLLHPDATLTSHTPIVHSSVQRSSYPRYAHVHSVLTLLFYNA